MRYFLISKNAVGALALAIVAAFAGCVATACAEITSPIRPCEYVSTPLTDSTSVVTYKTLPCFDANMQRVVRKR